MQESRIVYNTIVNMRLLRGFIIGLILLLILGNQGVAITQVERTRYFDATGQWVTGDFLEFYEQVPDPVELYGNPITPAFDSTESNDPSGILIQYFENARFELHPENPSELRVRITPLGEYYFQKDDIAPSAWNQNSPYACQSMSADTPPVCYDFLQYFNLNGGIAIFGYPVSELVTNKNRSVQYFDWAVFEWHPERSAGEQVSIEDLGARYFYDIREDVSLLEPADNGIIAQILEVRVSAFVQRAVIPPNGLQEVYVVVQNQILQPVSGAHVFMKLYLPSGEIRIFSMPLTNSNGISHERLNVQDEPAGLVRVVVDVHTFDRHVTTETSFRIWK